MIEDLECRVFRDDVCFVDSFRHDDEKSILEFRLLATKHMDQVSEPVQEKVVRVLTFTGVSDYLEDWKDGGNYNSEYIYCMIGIHESPKNESIQYLIILDDCEIVFSTVQIPIIEDC